MRARISAPTIQRAVELAGEGARLVLPIEGETFFAARRGYPVEREGIDFESLTLDELEAAYEVGLPGAYEAYLDALTQRHGSRRLRDLRPRELPRLTPGTHEAPMFPRPERRGLMDNERRKTELARWAKEVQLPPEGYEPIPGLVGRRQFGVCAAESAGARPRRALRRIGSPCGHPRRPRRPAARRALHEVLLPVQHRREGVRQARPDARLKTARGPATIPFLSRISYHSSLCGGVQLRLARLLEWGGGGRDPRHLFFRRRRPPRRGRSRASPVPPETAAPRRPPAPCPRPTGATTSPTWRGRLRSAETRPSPTWTRTSGCGPTPKP